MEKRAGLHGTHWALEPCGGQCGSGGGIRCEAWLWLLQGSPGALSRPQGWEEPGLRALPDLSFPSNTQALSGVFCAVLNLYLADIGCV